LALARLNPRVAQAENAAAMAQEGAAVAVAVIAIADTNS